MNPRIPIFILFYAALLAGCVAPDGPSEPVVDASETMTFLKPGLRPEMLLFPEYFLMEDFELHQHGRIPETALVGAGIKTALDLRIVRTRFSDALASKGWKTDQMEVGKQSFRLIASLKGEEVEIRAVQGGGATQVFILYQPRPEPATTPMPY
ncbi:MAG: hypothetical protein U9P12_05475 [Verrucomicrobiota bacterium]|nr:hypothetical protein [Verrucomicrobiota bacterium]